MVRFTRIPSFSYPSPLSRLPEHYYRHLQDLKRPSTRVHDRKPETDLLDLKYNEEKKRVERIPDMPIPVIYPKEADLGLWGGEGIVKGYIKPRKYFQAGWPRPKYWFPNLKRAVFYSEILDKHFTIVCTKRTFSLVDQYCGFDNYILRSDVQDLKSQLALLLRRKMLITLAKKEFRDSAHQKEMLEKYGDCIIPELSLTLVCVAATFKTSNTYQCMRKFSNKNAEADWFGLPVGEALRKYKMLNAKESVKPPLKYELTLKLLDQLEASKLEPNDDDTPKTGWMSKVKSSLGLGKS